MQVIRNGIAQRRRSVNSQRRRILVDGSPYAPSLYEWWPLDEAAASSNAIGAKGVIDITQTGNPGVGGSGRGTAYRTTNGTTQWFSVATNSSLASYGQDFWFSVWFYATADTGMIIASREQAPLSANVSILFRLETLDMKLYLGDGAGNLWPQSVGTAVMNTQHHIAVTARASDKAVKVCVDGGSVQSYTATFYPTSAAGTEKFSLGGETGELFSGRLKCVAKGNGTANGAFLSNALLQGLYNGGTPLLF